MKRAVQIFFIVFLVFSLSAKAQLHEYVFNNNFNEYNGGPALTEVLSCGAGVGSFSPQTSGTTSGACLSSTSYCFGDGGGLQYSNPNLIGSSYTINVFFRFSSLGGYARVIDFSNSASDAGIYLLGNCLNLYPNGNVGACPYFNTNSYYLITFVRDGATGAISVYVDGTLFGTYNDSGNLYHPATTTTPIIFFRDDNVVICENQPGCVKYISVSPLVASASDVAQMWNNITTITHATPVASPTVTINPTNTINCSNSSVTLTATSTATMVWNGGTLSNASNPAIVSASGTYTVTATDANGCFDTASVVVASDTAQNLNITVNSATICSGESVTLRANGGSAYVWSTSETTDSIVVSPVNTTSYTVNTSGGTCSGSAIATVTVSPSFSVSVNSPTICAGQTATLIANGASNYTWSAGAVSNGDSTATAVPATTMSYTVTAGIGACTDSAIAVVTVNPKPVANFGSVNACLGSNTTFIDSSITSSGTITAWKWDFGDSSPVSLNQNPVYQYTATGNYAVTLIVQNSLACSDTIVENTTVYFNPVTNFNANDVCFGDTVLFFDASNVDISASIVSYLWVFNDGSPTDTTANPHHYYADSGSYNVTLLCTTNQGCLNAVTKTVRVFDAPRPQFSVADICLGSAAVFVNNSIPPAMGSIGSQQWNFGDGSAINTAANPQHVYMATGTFPVTLIVRSSNLACADTLTDSVTVFPKPVAAFTTPQVCFGQSMNFNNLSFVSAPSSIVSWDWDFGNSGAVSTLQTPVYSYSSFGSYNVTLIVTSSNMACKDTITDSVVVHPLPHPAFTTYNVCEGSVAQFVDQSTMPSNITNDGILGWTWDFGNSSSTSNNQNASQQYTAIGTDTVELKVVSNFGCVDSVIRPIVINPNPVVNFTVSDTAGCESLCLVFQDASTISTGGNVAWEWTLGDNTESTDTVFTHCYSNDSIYAPVYRSISLKVTSDSGCTTLLTRNNYITVYPKPLAAFHTEPIVTTIANPIIDIKEHSIGANFWNWNFGDTDTSTLQYPQAHTYADTGTYTIQLIVTTNYTCTDTSYVSVVIEPDYMLYVPNAFTPNGDGLNDTFIPQGTFIDEFEMRIFDRWGNLVYKTNDMTQYWDGKTNTGNFLVLTDTYVYVIKAIDFKKRKHYVRGILTVHR